MSSSTQALKDFVSPQVATSIVPLHTVSCKKCVLAGTLYGCENLKVIAESSVGVSISTSIHLQESTLVKHRHIGVCP